MENKKTIRNVIIFSVFALVVGWIGVGIDKLLPEQEEEETLGMAFWLITPLLLVIILRSFFGDGWKDAGLKPNFKGNLNWYGIAFLIFPVVTLITVLTGSLFGAIDSSSFYATGYFEIFIGLFFINILKNIFEESVWRGYLTAKLITLKLSDWSIYLVVGLVWGLWHAPYYLSFLPEEDIYTVLPVDKLLFAFIAVVNITVWSVMFTEIFRITKSVWSAVLLHASEDAVVNHLVIDGYITFSPNTEIWFSPICGVFPTILFLIIGLWLRKQRMITLTKTTLNENI